MVTSVLPFINLLSSRVECFGTHMVILDVRRTDQVTKIPVRIAAISVLQFYMKYMYVCIYVVLVDTLRNTEKYKRILIICM